MRDDTALEDALFDLGEKQAESNQLRLLVHFRTHEARRAFSVLIGQRVHAGGDVAIYYPVQSKLPPEYLTHTAEHAVNQPDLFETKEDWHTAWQGMPAYKNQDLTPVQTITVFFSDRANRLAFAKLIDHPVTQETQFVWFPREKIDEVSGIRWHSAQNEVPRYPIYVPTKGRWALAHTIKCLERLGVPYYAVVQPQERERYVSVVKTGTILLLPEGLDGLVPTRNWIFEHAVASGAERHWQLDDNIRAFYRRHENRHIRMADATCLRVLEDFADRYENVAIAGFSYEMFVTRRSGDYPPFVFNTRVYSNSLINNCIPFRYRDVYNDDTDICLRALKAGWCTVQFNAFLAQKLATMVVKGGNTPIYLGKEQAVKDWEAHAAACKVCVACIDGYGVDKRPCDEGLTILERDGRWRMAESLRRQHPDVTIVGRRWNRWQHYVDYRQFKRNEPILRPDVVIEQGVNDYGLELIEVENGSITEDVPEEQQEDEEQTPQPRVAKAAGVPAGPSALAFLQALQAREPARVEKPSQPKESPALASSQPESGLQEPIPFDSQFFKDYLAVKGHRLLTKDGKFFISEASSLTDTERLVIKEHREELIALAEEWKDEAIRVSNAEQAYALPNDLQRVARVGGTQDEDAPTSSLSIMPPVGNLGDAPFIFDDHPTQTLAQFLGSEPPRIDSSFIPDEPPDLTGIEEVILNFATSGLDWAGGDRPGGVTIATLDGKLCRFLPFGFKYGGNLDEAAVKEWARAQLVGKKITNARTKFDIHHAREWGIDLEAQGCTFSDIQHTAALLDDHRKKVALDSLAADYFPSEPFVARVDERRHLEHHASEVAEREKFTALLVGRLRDVMYPEIDKQDLRRVQDLEDAVIPAVVEMEKNGSPIDMALLEQFGIECNRKHDELMWEVSRECGFAFEHTASGWKRLIESLHLTVPDSFSESALNEVEHPLVRKGQRASQYASLNSKIFKAYPEHIRDGILRYSINQLASDDGGTASGRFSIGIVQQVPNVYNHAEVFGDELFPRRLFIPGSGEYFEGDAAQIEFRLLVHYSENAKLLQAYRDDPWMSFHKQMQSMLGAYKPDMNYAHTKSYDFAAQYGAKSVKLAITMKFISERIGEEIRKAKRYDDPRLKTIKEIEAAFEKAHPEARKLLERASHLMKNECDDYCRRGDALHRQFPHRGYVKTLLGRRSRCINNYKPYIGLNRVLQGSGADIMKKKIVEVHAERKNTGFVMRITNHDALLGDATMPETKDKVAAILNVQSYPLKVPILWECGTGRTWADCK